MDGGTAVALGLLAEVVLEDDALVPDAKLAYCGARCNFKCFLATGVKAASASGVVVSEDCLDEDGRTGFSWESGTEGCTCSCGVGGCGGNA